LSLSPSRPFILRPVATSLLMAAILLVGIVSYTQLPVSALPEVDYPTIQVLTFYPGASPYVMATTVTAPLERQFGELQGLSQMTSTSSGGTSVIVMQFNLTLNIDAAHLDETTIAAVDKAVQVCPVGCIVLKRTGYREAYGERKYDRTPIGSDIRAKRNGGKP